MANKRGNRRRGSKLKLKGFNNLTKTLAFNIYDICYAPDPEARQRYLQYIDDEYNSERLTQILHQVADTIGANILNVATQDYDPMGASVTILISEEPVEPQPQPLTQLAHLDKSHLCVHTYPEEDSATGVATFRVDIDVSTCGRISPLKALNHLISSFDSDIVLLDYKVRGFTRDVQGRKHYIDHRIYSIQQYIQSQLREHYHCVDINIHQENLFHTKMLIRDLDLDNYLFTCSAADLKPAERQRIRSLLEREMTEIFYSKNIYS